MSSDPPPPQHGSAEPIAAAPAVPISNTAQDTTLSVAPMEQAGPVTGAAGVATFTASASVDAPPSTHAQPDASATAAQAGAPATAAEPATAPAVPAALAIPASGEPATVLPSPVPTPVASVPKPKVKPRKTPIKKSINKLKVDSARNAGVQAQSAPAAESSKMAANRRVMPARLRRVGNLLEGSSLGVELAGLLGDSEAQSSTDQSVALPANARLMITSEHEKYTAKAWEDKEATTSYKSYFDNEDVQRACRERAEIETPDYDSWNEVEFQGRKRTFEPTTDLSVEAYEALQRSSVLREKRQRKLERDRIIKDRTKVADRIDMLKSVESKHFFPIIRARQALQGDTAGPSTASSSALGPAEGSVQTPSAEAVVAGQAFPSELPVPADGSASLAQSPAQAEAQNGDAVIARSESIAANGAIPVEAVEALLNGGSSSHVGEERTATSSASVAAVLPQRNGPSASQPNGSSASLEVPNGITTEAGPSASREAPNGAAPEVDLSTIAAETAAAPTARPKRGRRSKGSNETASSSTSQNPALLAASLSAAAAGTKLSATMSDEAQMMHVSAEQLRKDLMREASEILQKYDAAIAHMSIGLDLVLGEREDGAEATASGAAGGGKAAGSGGGAKASASRPGPRKPRYAESSSEPSDVESSDSPEPAPAAKRQKRGEQAVRGSRHSVSSAKADATMDLDTSVDSIKRKPPAPTTAPAKGARSSARASKGKSRSVADEDPVAIRPPPVRATVSASARQAGIQHDRDLRMAMPLDIPFRTFDNPWADSESESEMKEAPFVRPIASSVLSPNPSICPSSPPVSPTTSAPAAPSPSASAIMPEGRLPMNLAFALHPIPYRPKSSSGSEVTAVTAQEEMYVPSPVQTTFPPSTAADPTLQQPQSQGHDALPQEAQPQDLASVQPTAERGSLPRDQHEATAVSAEGQPPTIPPPEYRPGSLICVDVPPRPAFHTLVCWGCYPFSSAGLPKDATEDEILRDRGLWTEAQWDARIFGDEGREGERTSEERRAMLLYGWLTPDRRRPAAMKKEEPIEDAAPNEIAATAQSQPPADSQSAAAEPEAALANGSAQTRSQQAKVAPQKGHDFAMQYAQRAEYVNSMLRPAVPQPTRKYETVEETHLHKVAPSLYELSQTHIAYTQQMEKWEADVRAAEPGTAPPPRPEWDLVLRDICSMAKPVKLTKGKGKESAALSSSGPAVAQQRAAEQHKEYQSELQNWQHVVDNLPPGAMVPPKPTMSDFARQVGHGISKGGGSKAKGGTKTKGKKQDAKATAAAHAGSTGSGGNARRSSSVSSTSSPRPTRTLRSNASTTSAATAASAAAPADAPAAQEPGASSVTETAAKPSTQPPSLPAAPVGSATVAATEEPAPSAPIETSADTARNAPDSVADADEDTKDVDNSPSKRKRRVPSAFGTRSSSTRIKTLLALGERPPLRELERDEPFDRLMESRLRRWHYLAAVDAGEPSAGSATSAKKCYVPGTPPGSDLGSGRWRMLMQTAREADERWLASCREFDAQKRLEAEGREREEEDDAAEEAAVEEEEEEDDALADSVS
ncbi:hypothetical protein V8E36_006164 [Tilletia maclaganii]